jgi:hypothetical protein
LKSKTNQTKKIVSCASDFSVPGSRTISCNHRYPAECPLMAGTAEFHTGDLAEILSGPFQRRLSVILHRYQESELWLVAVYYPSENCFIHTYLNEEQLKVIGHLEGT